MASDKRGFRPRTSGRISAARLGHTRLESTDRTLLGDHFPAEDGLVHRRANLTQRLAASARHTMLWLDAFAVGQAL